MSVLVVDLFEGPGVDSLDGQGFLEAGSPVGFLALWLPPDLPGKCIKNYRSGNLSLSVIVLVRNVIN